MVGGANMRHRKVILLVVVLSVLLLSSCSKVDQPDEPEINETATETAVNDVSTDISGIGILDKDLDMSELDDIDRDLEDISNGW